MCEQHLGRDINSASNCYRFPPEAAAMSHEYGSYRYLFLTLRFRVLPPVLYLFCSSFVQTHNSRVDYRLRFIARPNAVENNGLIPNNTIERKAIKSHRYTCEDLRLIKTKNSHPSIFQENIFIINIKVR